MKLIVTTEESQRLTDVVIGAPDEEYRRLLLSSGVITTEEFGVMTSGARVSQIVADGLLAKAFGPVVIAVEVDGPK